MPEALKPCPFCGGIATCARDPGDDHHVTCEDYGVEVYFCLPEESESVSGAWNERADRWIPCDLEMPEPRASVLCYVHIDHLGTAGIRCLGFYDERDAAWYLDGWGSVAKQDVAHWMQLPEPPGKL